MTSNPELEVEELREDEESIEGDADDERVEDDPAAHLKDLEDGAGCTEIWSHLSESRDDD
ncbi:hypothetical protein ACFQJC_05355 [Haloferax namakaokahaiae]|uniref:Uncharacterized protein n=1 Tax=Haloferax namakaokahaiae TaxID=1748331 RepID=A0ABD5ZCR2_9EURY